MPEGQSVSGSAYRTPQTQSAARPSQPRRSAVGSMAASTALAKPQGVGSEAPTGAAWAAESEAVHTSSLRPSWWSGKKLADGSALRSSRP